MTSTITLTPPTWRDGRDTAPAKGRTGSSAVETSTRPGTPPPRAAKLGSLSRLWLGALADDARHAEPLERMALALLVVAAGTALAGAVAANAQLVTGWSGFVRWVSSALF